MNGSHDESQGRAPATPQSPPATGGSPSPGQARAAGPAPGAAPYTPPAYGPGSYAPPPRAARDPRSKSSAAAALLSLFPGLGQIYVGYYLRGFVHALIVAGTITLLAAGDLDELTPLFGLFLAFFWLYNVIDAGRRASLYNMALAGDTDIELPRDFRMPGGEGSILGGLILVVVGVVLLGYTVFGISLDWVADWWPLAPIVLGVWLIVKALQEKSRETPAR